MPSKNENFQAQPAEYLSSDSRPSSSDILKKAIYLLYLVIRKLLQQSGAFAGYHDGFFQPPLLETLLPHNITIARCFRQQGTDIEATNNLATTTLFLSTVIGYVVMDRMLLIYGWSISSYSTQIIPNIAAHFYLPHSPP